MPREEADTPVIPRMRFSSWGWGMPVSLVIAMQLYCGGCVRWSSLPRKCYILYRILVTPRNRERWLTEGWLMLPPSHRPSVS